MNQDAFEQDVSRALDHGDKRMNTLTDEITAELLEACMKLQKLSVATTK